ncbi:LysM peptidoglycan-binding domain-containing protein [Lacrimispora indolis]|uniref:LysM peptidoglycan-binding domain-containing protein n=1 Tax=Lacrimispora indolis TaxID=69825 RepID=UPI000402E74C|nr:LysM peptidoglycan-binding domain-containing protein [[Clostridium] methoxybenzovorans]
MKARQSYVVVKYNNKDITKTITDYIEGFEYKDNASGSADTVTLKLNNKSGKWSGSWIPIQGDYIKTIIKLTNWKKEGDNRSFDCGYFLIDDLSYSGPPSQASIGGISTPIDTDFNVTKKSKTWKSTSVKGILSEIAKGAGVGLYFSGQDYPIEEMEQSDQEDVTFAFNICKSYNLAMKLYNKKIVVFDQTEYEKKKASFTITRENAESYSINRSMTRQYDGVTISYTDATKNQTLTYQFMLKNGNRIMKLNETAESLQDAEIKAKAKLLEHNRQCQTMNVTVKGDTKYIASKCAEIDGWGKLDGKYYIDTVTHSKDAGSGYTCTLEMHLTLVVKGVTVATVQSGDTVKKAADSSATSKTYTIVSGDTLWKISTKNLGSGAKYMQIYNANSGTIESAAKSHGKSSSSNGHWIYPGTTLTIPG